MSNWKIGDKVKILDKEDWIPILEKQECKVTPSFIEKWAGKSAVITNSKSDVDVRINIDPHNTVKWYSEDFEKREYNCNDLVFDRLKGVS